MAALTIRVETFVPAPVEAVYGALLDPEMHARTAPGRERVVPPYPQVARPGEKRVRRGMKRSFAPGGWGEGGHSQSEAAGGWGLDLGDEVTFEATHFGIRQRLTARITAVDPPRSFEDTQVRGFFRSLTHRHEFIPEGEGTRMIDEMTFSSPLGPLFDHFVLGPYLKRFLEKRGQALATCLGDVSSRH